MSDIDDLEGQQEAPAAPPPPAPAPLTREEIAELLDERVAAQLAPWVQGFNYLAAGREEDRAALLDLVGDTRRNRALLESLADSTLPEGTRQQLENDLTAKASAAELARLKAEATKRLTPPPTDDDALTKNWYVGTERAILQGEAEEQDGNFAEAERTWAGKELPLPGRPLGERMAAFHKLAVKAIRKTADEAREREQSRAGVTVESTRQTGGTGRNTADIWAAYGRGDVEWGPQVQAAGRALGAI